MYRMQHLHSIEFCWGITSTFNLVLLRHDSMKMAKLTLKQPELVDENSTRTKFTIPEIIMIDWCFDFTRKRNNLRGSHSNYPAMIRSVDFFQLIFFCVLDSCYAFFFITKDEKKKKRKKKKKKTLKMEEADD